MSLFALFLIGAIVAAVAGLVLVLMVRGDLAQPDPYDYRNEGPME
jgi:beta-lactamase regulating signal transducer with metallopeptidase domain